MPAPRTLWQLVFRDVLLHTLLGLSVALLLLVVQNVLRFLEVLLAAGASGSAVLELAQIILPTYLAYAIPTALLFGVLLSFGRMSADGEIIAVRASGVSLGRLLPPILLLGAVFAVVTAYVSFEVEPRSYLQMKQLVKKLGRSVSLIEPGRFRTLGDRLVYVHDLGDDDCPLEGVMVADFSVEERTFYVAAQCGRIDGEEDDDSLRLGLTNGSIHFEEPDGDRYRLIRFNEMTTELDISRYLGRGVRARNLTFRELIQARDGFARGQGPELSDGEGALHVDMQIHRRLAFSLASVTLAMLAMPLAIRPRRAGRSWGALTAVAVMGLYWCLFAVGELVAEGGWAPAGVAFWAPNVIVLALAIALLRRASKIDA
jgi:lipopolysaccharide export system permease protein